MKRIPGIRLEAHVIAGNPVRQACEGLCELSNRVGIMVTADLNDVQILVMPGMPVEEAMEQYVANGRQSPWHYEGDEKAGKRG